MRATAKPHHMLSMPLAACTVWALLLYAVTPVASAAPKSGWSVFGGAASHSSSGEITKGTLQGSTFSISSSGLSIGGDYQFALSDEFSLNLFLVSSSESASSTELLIDSAGHAIWGIQGRFWMEGLLVGGHIGNYSEVLSDTNAGTSVVSTGFGSGLVVGWESEGGLFGAVQIDQVTVKASDASTNVSGTRLHVGYRWK